MMETGTNLKILGCSGGAEPGRPPTCFLLGDAVAIDAGSLASSLTLEEQRKVRHILLTHCHFDHIRELPIFLDNTFEPERGPIVIHALPEVLQSLKKYVFNDAIWPDVTSFDPPPVALEEIRFGCSLRLVSAGTEFEVRPVPSYHGVPAASYLIQSLGRKSNERNETNSSQYSSDDGEGGPASWHALTTDTGFDTKFFDDLRSTPGLRTLIVEVSFPDRLDALARTSFHLTPAMLEQGLGPVLQAHPRLRIYISHLKPRFRGEIAEELSRLELPIEILEVDRLISID